MLGEDVPVSQERVIFVLTIMDRGEGSDISLMCCQLDRMEVVRIRSSCTLLSLKVCVRGSCLQSCAVSSSRAVYSDD